MNSAIGYGDIVHYKTLKFQTLMPTVFHTGELKTLTLHLINGALANTVHQDR